MTDGRFVLALLALAALALLLAAYYDGDRRP